ncbi:MAG: SMI1/KNR4 family protein [Betaproteobacteria bacterium]|nr:SMI1/KNR4 family protein [Betaproteobacteria bacterium]
MMTFDNVAKRLEFHEEFEHGAGANANMISAAEASLGVTFPASYRRFLTDYGWSCIGRFEIYGLGGDVPAWLDVVKMTSIERAGAHARLPAHLIPVHYEGDGDHVCIDTSQRSGDTAAMVFWNHDLGTRQAPEKIADDFADWLSSLL